MPISLLTVGQTDRAEARPLTEWLSATLQATDTKHFAELSTALRDASTAGWVPDLIVIVQCWPDEFSATEIASLFALAPLARIVVAYGAWCESDGRNRNLWPLAVRVPLSGAAARIEREWRLLHAADGIEPLPASASREEVFAADHRPPAETSSPQTILVVSPDRAYWHYLNELLASAGHIVCRAEAPSPGSRPTTIVFDADPWDEARSDQLQLLLEQNPTVKAIALMSLPNPEHESALAALGAITVLSKLGDQACILNAIKPAAVR
jgi:hypothetical protein